MQYSEARALILTGDLIAVKKRSGPLAIGTRLVTGSDYTHTGVVVWVAGRLLVAQANAGGCNLVPLSQFAPYKFDVYLCPVGRAAAERALWDAIGVKTTYDFVDLARIALHIWFGMKLPEKDDGSVICSAFSALIYLLAGWQAPGLPSIPWPGAIAHALGDVPFLEVIR